MNDGVRVSVTTRDMTIGDVTKALEGYIGERLLAVKYGIGSQAGQFPGISKEFPGMLTTENHRYEFFHYLSENGLTIYCEDTKYPSYEECVKDQTSGCATLERLAKEKGGFDVDVKCSPSCTIFLRAGGTMSYFVEPKEQEIATAMSL